MKTGTRLGLSFALVLLLLFMVTALGLQQMTQFQTRLDQITGVNNVKVKLATAMRDSVFERLIALRNLALGGSVSEMQDEAQRIKQETLRYSEVEQKLKQKIDASSSAAKQEGALLLELKRFETAATPLIDKATELAQASQVDQAYTVLTKELLPLQHKWMTQLDALIAFEDRQSDLSTSEARSAYGAARTSILSIGVLAVVIGALIAFLLTRKLVRQLGGEPDYAARIVGQIAAGDLTVHIDLKPHDRASLLFAMKSMRDNLATMVGNLRSDSNAIVAVSSEISAGNADLSSRTEQQASALERTASRMDNLTATVKYNVDHVRHANQLAASASGVALTGSAEVLRVVETMSSINASAKRIVDIIGVINGIAFQTNILALNAAVEASRAGEQGRGFAVVATEVRGLAQRSAEAAKEIKTLIGDAVDKVDSGSALADQAGATMDALAGSIKRVTDIMLEITAASNDQSAEIEQINQAIAQMDGVTQQNAALVEQAAAATEHMQERALGLAGALQVFKVDNEPAPHRKDFWPAIENGQRLIA